MGKGTTNNLDWIEWNASLVNSKIDINSKKRISQNNNEIT